MRRALKDAYCIAGIRREVNRSERRLLAGAGIESMSPGDALDADLEAVARVDVLAFPLSAPWARSRDMTAFLRRVGAAHAVPVHDGLLSEAGRAVYLRQAGQLGSSRTTIHDLAGGGTASF